ncbi:MAG: polysaccharide biosynthesis protein, partial [Clostridia bacterium]|nr:polysaccharide biosynthesis protein [Clostridia bacterium]
MQNRNNPKKRCVRMRMAGIVEKVFLDLLAILAAFTITVVALPAYVPGPRTMVFYGWLLCHVVIAFVSFVAARIYLISYRAFSFLDATRLTAALGIILVLELMVDAASKAVHFSAVLFYVLMLGVFMLAIRSLSRARSIMGNKSWHKHHGEKVVIVGVGEAGTTIIKELQSTDKADMNPVAALDDDPSKLGMRICGVPVVGTTHDVAETVKKFGATRILVAMPSVPAGVLKDVLDRCQMPKVPVLTLPGIYQLANGTVTTAAIRNVDVQDLLGREQIKVNLDEIGSYLKDRTVLVTGGGGSIGSELCRQIATSNPKLLIIFDIYENNAYEIEQELRRHHPDLNLLVLIGSIRDEGKLKDVFEKYHPEIVFNAAAHKHVPLMETSPNEAVKNNVFGTLNVARCADTYGALRFVQ